MNKLIFYILFSCCFCWKAWGQTPLVIAHRGYVKGASVQLLENSIKDLSKLKSYGVRGVEFDIRKTADGKYIVLHDASMSVTTEYEGKADVKQMPLKEVKKYKLVSRKGNKSKEKIPTLEKYLKSLRRNKYLLMPHRKDISINDLYGHIKKAELLDKVILFESSGNMDKAVALYGNDKPKVLSGYAFKQLSEKELLSFERFLPDCYIDMDVSIYSKEYMERVISHGFGIALENLQGERPAVTKEMMKDIEILFTDFGNLYYNETL